ncbi:hypothetical protein LSPCS325_40860 [Lysinibacillus sp. CTST325]
MALLSVALTVLSVALISIHHLGSSFRRFDCSIRRSGDSFRHFGSSFRRSSFHPSPWLFFPSL